MYKQVFPSSNLPDTTALEFTAFVSNVHNLPDGSIELSLDLGSLPSLQASNGDLLNTDTAMAEVSANPTEILKLVGVASEDELEGAEFIITLSSKGFLPVTVYQEFDSTGINLYIESVQH